MKSRRKRPATLARSVPRQETTRPTAAYRLALDNLPCCSINFSTRSHSARTTRAFLSCCALIRGAYSDSSGTTSYDATMYSITRSSSSNPSHTARRALWARPSLLDSSGVPFPTRRWAFSGTLSQPSSTASSSAPGISDCRKTQAILCRLGKRSGSLSKFPNIT